MLWVLGFVLSFCGLFIWLEFGTMYPRSGGEKVYLEAVYKKPKYLATVIFAVNAIILGFTASGCIVSTVPHYLSFTTDHRGRSLPASMSRVKNLASLHELTSFLSILVAAGHSAGQWTTRGIALGGTRCPIFLAQGRVS